MEASGLTKTDGELMLFDHCQVDWAESKHKTAKHGVWTVETINWTVAGSGQVHRNRYVMLGLAPAAAFATMITALSDEVAENVVAIREATQEESVAFFHND